MSLSSGIEKVNDRLYRAYLGEDIVEFGDEGEEEFKPVLTLTRWNREATLKIVYDDKDMITKQTSLQEDKLTYATPSMDLRWYTLTPDEQNELGGVEYEFILKAKPASNVLAFTIETRNLKYILQPPLTQEELNVGAFRPDNVVGSYAVYHMSKRDNRYKAGKAYHLYRPEAIDADGNRVWCSQSIDVASGTYTITVPQKYLDTANYPVTVDPTFGKTDIGGSTSKQGSDNKVACKYNLAVDGDASKITVYANYGAQNYKCCVYDDNAGAPDDLEGTTQQVNIGAGTKWEDFAFAAPLSLTSGNHWLTINGESTGWILYYDAGAANQLAWLAENYAVYPADPFGVPDGYIAWEMSIYATYTVPSGGSKRLLVGVGI